MGRASIRTTSTRDLKALRKSPWISPQMKGAITKELKRRKR